MERKKWTECSVVFLEKQKVQVTKTSSLLSVPFCELGSALRLSSQYFAAIPIRNIAELVHAFWFFLSTIMVFAAVRTHFPRKATPCLVDGTAINKRPFKYNNEHTLLRSGRLVEFLQRSPSNRAAGFRIHEGGQFFFYYYSFPFFSFFSLYG